MRNSTLEWVVGQSLPKKSVRKSTTRRRTVVHVETSDEDCGGYSSVDEVHIVKKNGKKVHFEASATRVREGARCSEPGKKEAAKEPVDKEGGAGSCCRSAANSSGDPNKEEAKKDDKSKPAKTIHTCAKFEPEKPQAKEEKPKAEVCKGCEASNEGENKKKNDQSQSNKSCNQCGESKEGEKPAKGKSDKDRNAAGKGDTAARQNQKPTNINIATIGINDKPRNMPERVLSASRADVVLREDVIECKSDPRPNAFFDIKTGVLRVYHGPIYGNPFASLIPLSSTMKATRNFSPLGFAGPPQQQTGPPPMPTSPQFANQGMPGSPQNGWMQVLAGLMSSAMANNNGKSGNPAAATGGDSWGNTSTAVGTQTSGENNEGQANADSWGAGGNQAQPSGQDNGVQTNNDSWGEGGGEQAQSGKGGTSGDVWGGNADSSNNNDTYGWAGDSGDTNDRNSNAQDSWGVNNNNNSIRQGQQGQQSQQNDSGAWGGQWQTNNSNNQNGTWGGQNNESSAGGDNRGTNQNSGNNVEQDSGNNLNSGGNQGSQPAAQTFVPPVDPWANIYATMGRQPQGTNTGNGQGGFNSNNNNTSPAQRPNNNVVGPPNGGGGGGGWGMQGNQNQQWQNINNSNNAQGLSNNFNSEVQQSWGGGNNRLQQNAGGGGNGSWGNSGGTGNNNSSQANAQSSGW